MSTIVYAVGQERFGTMKTKEEASPVNPIDARKRYRDKLRTEIDSLTKQYIRLRNINWQDWKYTSFAIFIKTFDVTVQWAETKLLRTSSKIHLTSVYAMNIETFCRINFLSKIQIDARH